MTLQEKIKANDKIFRAADKVRFAFELQTGKRYNEHAKLLADKAPNVAWQYAIDAASMAERIVFAI